MAEAIFITSRQNTRIRELREALAHPPQPSSENKLLAVEGQHLVEEAIRSGLHIRTLFLEDDHPLPPGLSTAVDVLRVSSAAFASVTQTRSPQGIAAMLAAPRFSLQHALRYPALLVVAEALQDPGNLGTLIRSAEAFGATGVLLLSEARNGSTATVNPFNGKCVRASTGSVFRIPVLPVQQSEVAELRKHSVQLLAAVGARGGQDTFTTADLRRPTAFLIGNEGAGLSAGLRELANAPITVPCSGPVESLNAGVAASILLFCAQQQRGSEAVHEPL